MLADLAVAAALLTGGAILIPAIKKHLPDIDTNEVLCRTGTRLKSQEDRSKLDLQLYRAGLEIKSEWFHGLRASLAGLWIVCLIPVSLIWPKALFLILIAPMLYILPDMWLKKKIAERKRNITNSLAEFNLFLATALSAGTNILMALTEASRATAGPLQEEVSMAIKDHLSGRNLTDALYVMSSRLQVDELNSLVRTIDQIYNKGATAADTMRKYSDQMRIERKFNNMEEAGKLSIKLIVPVLVFILIPCLLVLGYPAVYTLMQTF